MIWVEFPGGVLMDTEQTTSGHVINQRNKAFIRVPSGKDFNMAGLAKTNTGCILSTSLFFLNLTQQQAFDFPPSLSKGIEHLIWNVSGFLWAGLEPMVQHVKYERQHMSSSEDRRHLSNSPWHTNTQHCLTPSLNATYWMAHTLPPDCFDLPPALPSLLQRQNILPSRWNIYLREDQYWTTLHKSTQCIFNWALK